MSEARLIVGAMSGTSADGVDVAIVRIAGRGLDMHAQLLLHHQRTYDEALKKEIFAFRAGEVRDDVLGRLARMGRQITLTCATAVNEALLAANVPAKQIEAVAAHGQTLFHNPPSTIQWIDPSLLAAETGCQIVSDFRRADLAAGGQGAPLVPFADYILFRHPAKSRILLNIGGIANLTYLPANCTIDQVVAFDTGPGNCLSDQLVRNATDGKKTFDEGGETALRGVPDEELVEQALKHPFFPKLPPKSTDLPEMMDALRLGIREKKSDRLESTLATACLLTARSIARAVASLNPVDEVIVSGGGTRNAAIMRNLRQELGALPIQTTDSSAVPSPAKEAMAFSLLAAATLDGIPSNVPSATGARRAVVLGSITPKP